MGKDLLILYALIINTIEKIKNQQKDDRYTRGLEILNLIKNNFIPEEKKDEQKKEKKLKIDNTLKCIEDNNNISFIDETFKTSIVEEREKFILFLNQLSNDSIIILKTYISNTFKSQNKNFSDLEKKYKYIEDTIDFSRILNQYIKIEKMKNPNKFLDINKTLVNFNDYSSILNSYKHGDFILALLGKFFEQNGIKTHILKEKDMNYDNLELTTLQTVFSLGSQRKYKIHLDFGEEENKKILNDNIYQTNFLNIWKKNIADKLNIDINRVILKDIRYGSIEGKLAIPDETKEIEVKIQELKNNRNVIEIIKEVMVNEIILSPDILDPKGDRYKGWGINESRGGEKYIPPLDGWIGIGLKVLNKYDDNNKWLGYRNFNGEYSVAYYGLHNFLNDTETELNDLNNYIRDIATIINEKAFIEEDNKRSGILRSKCGGGVCLFQDPKYAEYCAGEIIWKGFLFKILLMCRVNPNKIRQPIDHDYFWILNPTPDEIRPYRILIKIIDNSPLSMDYKLITFKSPVKYIMDAINSNDFSFYNLIDDNRFKNNISYINGQKLSDEHFVIRLYSTIYYYFITNYMFRKNIEDNYHNKRGFDQHQLNSWICCMQKAIKNNKNVKNGTKVYRGVIYKFPENINVGSRFYFSAFISTSIDKNVAENFIKNRMKNNKESTMMTISIQNNGTDDDHPNYCFYINDISYSSDQKEVLFCSHCYYLVTKIERTNERDYVDLVCLGYLLNNVEKFKENDDEEDKDVKKLKKDKDEEEDKDEKKLKEDKDDDDEEKGKDVKKLKEDKDDDDEEEGKDVKKFKEDEEYDDEEDDDYKDDDDDEEDDKDDDY